MRRECIIYVMISYKKKQGYFRCGDFNSCITSSMLRELAIIFFLRLIHIFKIEIDYILTFGLIYDKLP